MLPSLRYLPVDKKSATPASRMERYSATDRPGANKSKSALAGVA